MAALNFFISLAGATMLLLFAVRMVQTGIERSFGASFKRLVTQQKNKLRAAFSGTVLAIVLQSSAAVALLTAAFAGTGAMAFGPGLAVVLGADLGSALVVQLLSFRLDWLVPLLLTVGGYLFVKTSRRKMRQAGRILLGIAFILLALRFLREAMDPIRDSGFLPFIAGYLSEDGITAFLVGAALAVVMHSSVAVILMCVTLVAIGALPVEAGVWLVLGANLGSAVIPVWLSRGMVPAARRIPLANLMVRGTAAILALFILGQVPLADLLSGQNAGQSLVTVHLLFNAALLIFLPVVGRLEPMMLSFMPDLTEAKSVAPEHQSSLDQSALESPRRSLTCLRREVLRMSNMVEIMARPVMQRYVDGDLELIKTARASDGFINQALGDIRRYVADMPNKEMSKADSRKTRDLTEYAINMENAGDIIAKTLLPLAARKKKQGLKFSDAGWIELQQMHEQVVANMALAFDVLATENLESARLLIEEKTDMARRERSSRKKHLKRLRNGEEVTFESSDLHLETLKGLRELNSQIASVAYPILYRNGLLLETRLVSNVEEDVE